MVSIALLNASSTTVRLTFFTHKPFPVPVLRPNLRHFLNWNPLSLRQETPYKNGHDNDKKSEKYEQSKLETAQHWQEDLSNEECEDHLNKCSSCEANQSSGNFDKHKMGRVKRRRFT